MYKIIYDTASRVPAFVTLKNKVSRFELNLFSARCRLRCLLRSIDNKPPSGGMLFGILCVKNPKYVEMAIVNINSLHFLNQNNKVILYVDDCCFQKYQEVKHRVDYPGLVQVKRQWYKLVVPWQKCKLEILIDISKKGGALVDADSRWYTLPHLESKFTYFLTPAYKITESPSEYKLVSKIVGVKKAKTWTHFATGFVCIPRKYMDPTLIKTIWRYYEIICSKVNNDNLSRLRDELAINLSVQTYIQQKDIRTLKDVDGPGDKRVLQSYYYGCWNFIID